MKLILRCLLLLRRLGQPTPPPRWQLVGRLHRYFNIEVLVRSTVTQLVEKVLAQVTAKPKARKVHKSWDGLKEMAPSRCCLLTGCCFFLEVLGNCSWIVVFSEEVLVHSGWVAGAVHLGWVAVNSRLVVLALHLERPNMGVKCHMRVFF